MFHPGTGVPQNCGRPPVPSSSVSWGHLTHPRCLLSFFGGWRGKQSRFLPLCYVRSESSLSSNSLIRSTFLVIPLPWNSGLPFFSGIFFFLFSELLWRTYFFLPLSNGSSICFKPAFAWVVMKGREASPVIFLHINHKSIL